MREVITDHFHVTDVSKERAEFTLAQIHHAYDNALNFLYWMQTRPEEKSAFRTLSHKVQDVCVQRLSYMFSPSICGAKHVAGLLDQICRELDKDKFKNVWNKADRLALKLYATIEAHGRNWEVMRRLVREETGWYITAGYNECPTYDEIKCIIEKEKYVEQSLALMELRERCVKTSMFLKLKNFLRSSGQQRIGKELVCQQN